MSTSPPSTDSNWSVSYDACRTRDSEEPPYIIHVFGLRLKRNAASIEEGQQRAEAFARNLVAEAAEKLS